MAIDPNEDWRSYASRRYKEKNIGTTFKLREGENSVRILPRKNPGGKLGGPPFYEYYKHQEVGPKKRFLTCGKDIQGEGECWLCDTVIPALTAIDKKAAKLRAQALEPKEQFALQVAYLDEDGKFRGPVLWNVSAGGKRSLATQILGVLKSTKRDYVDIRKGYNLNIERTGTGFTDTKYGSIIADEEPTPITKKVFDGMKTFEELITPYSEEQQKAAYHNREVEEEALDDLGDNDEPLGEESLGEPEKPASTTARKGTAKKTAARQPESEPELPFGDEGEAEELGADDLEEVPAGDASAESDSEFDELFGDLDAPEPAGAKPVAAKKAAGGKKK